MSVHIFLLLILNFSNKCSIHSSTVLLLYEYVFHVKYSNLLSHETNGRLLDDKSILNKIILNII
jgi:hypothetical protein